EPVRKRKNISKKISKAYKRPRVETSEVECEDQEKLPENPKEAEKEPEDNNSSSLLSSSSSSSNDDDSEEEMDEND
ncbi:41813_t:CDS:2, partial [Gigaspora margarita]